MNFFGPPDTSPQPLDIAKIEGEVLTDLFNKMSQTCFKKCVPRVGGDNPELTVGEMSCVDRCVGKYLMAQDEVGQVLQRFESALKAKQEAEAKMQQQMGLRPGGK